jgi:hypothetical protein
VRSPRSCCSTTRPRPRCIGTGSRQFQRSLLAEGLPLAWIVDVGVAHPAFSAVQSLFMAKRLDIGLRFEPDAPLTADDWLQWGGRGTPPATRAEGACS